MLLQESQRRQELLIGYLYEMAETCKDDIGIRETVIKLRDLYQGGFRHNYSDFFRVIVEISRDDNEYNLDYLSNNIVAARELVEKDYINGEKEFKGLYAPLSKLSDHLNLEIGRYSYSSISEQKVRDLEKRNQTLQNELRDATTKLAEAQKTVSSVQTELIAVLSIFAAIVLTFSGSMSFLGNALTGIQNSPFFKTTFFVLLCGFVISNTVFMLMYLVAKITRRSIYARCMTLDCTCNDNGTPKCKGITRIRKRLPYVFWLNFVILAFMVVDVVVWYFERVYNFIP